MLVESWKVFCFAGFQQLLDDLDDLCLDTPDAPEVIYLVAVIFVFTGFLSVTFMYGNNKQTSCVTYIVDMKYWFYSTALSIYSKPLSF